MGVYFFQINGCRGSIKIGFTNNLEKRIPFLTIGGGGQREVLAFYPSWTREDERILHIKFKEYRQIGEWFSPASDIFNFISAPSKPSRSKQDNTIFMVRIPMDLKKKLNHYSKKNKTNVDFEFTEAIRKHVERRKSEQSVTG